MTAPLSLSAVEPLPTVPSGGHSLPLRFSSVADSTSRSEPRPYRRRLVVGVFGSAAVIAAFAITQVTANLGYDGTATRYRVATETVTATKIQVGGEVTELRELTGAARAILGTENRLIAIDIELESALTASVESAETTASQIDVMIAAAFPAAGAKPAWFWELFSATAKLEDGIGEANRRSAELRSAERELTTAEHGLTTSGLAVMSAAGVAAAGFEAAHLSARNDAVISLRSTAAAAMAIKTIDANTAATFIALQDAAAQVVLTEAAEVAEKSGPLLNPRLEVEAFARSLAPGVLLEFDWSPLVNGAGYNGGMGGYTTWWWDDPDRAVIELSNSVAEQWPAARSKALVAHEVGHAISVKCADMYDSSTQDSIEKWATAWAISMGYTDDANGVWAYGYPPQNYIDAAADCR